MSYFTTLVAEEAQRGSSGTPYLALILQSIEERQPLPSSTTATFSPKDDAEAPEVTVTPESPLNQQKQKEESEPAPSGATTLVVPSTESMAPQEERKETAKTEPAPKTNKKSEEHQDVQGEKLGRRYSLNSQPTTGGSFSTARSSSATGSSAPVSALEAVFRAFAQFGERDHRKPSTATSITPRSTTPRVAIPLALMEGSKFVKMLKDAKLLSKSKSFTTTDVDIIFNKTVKKGDRRISFAQFQEMALPEIAKRKGVSEQAVMDKIIECGGPRLNTHVTPIKSLSPSGDRILNSFKTPPPTPSLEPVETKEAEEPPPSLLGDELAQKLRRTFTAFAMFGSSTSAAVCAMDGSKFAKMCKDSQLIDLSKKGGKLFSMIDVDITFNKTVKKGERRIGFEQFRDQALPFMCAKRKETPTELATIISNCEGPIINRAPAPASQSRGSGSPIPRDRGSSSGRSKTTTVSSVPSSSSSSSKKQDHTTPLSEEEVIVGGSRQPTTGSSSSMLAKLAIAAEEDGTTQDFYLLRKLNDAAVAVDVVPNSVVDDDSPIRRSNNNNVNRSSSKQLVVEGLLDATTASSSSGSPKKEYRSVEESMLLIQKHRENRDKLKRDRQAADKERRKRENEEADRIVEEKRKEVELARGDREQKMHERLEQLRQRKEARELEFLVGERRAKEVLHRKTKTDQFEEDYSKRCEVEEIERRQQLEERRHKLRQPVLVGVEDAQKMLKENELKKSRRALEVQAQLEHAEATKPVHWHGNSYLRATEEFVRNKAVAEDQKHVAMYRFAKMQEFGKLVKHIADDTGKVPLPYSHGRLASLAPITSSTTGGFSPIAAMGQGGRQSAPPTVGKAPQSIKERVKMGNDFLKQAIKEKAPLPPGLKLNPLKNDEEQRQKKEHAQFKLRKKQGDQFLRELRDATGHVQPKPLENVQDYLADVKKLRHKANSIENKLVFKGVDLAGGGGGGGNLDNHMDASEMELPFKSAMEMVSEVDDVLECVRTKLRLLERIDKFEHPSGNMEEKKKPAK